MLLEQLTVGEPRRATLLPFALPDVTEREVDGVVEVLRSGWLTTGPKTKQFEQDFASYVGARYAVALNSGTAALHLALDAIGLRASDEVIVPAYTFTATAEVVRYFDARLVLVDVDPETLNLCVAAAQRAVTDRTRAIIGVDIAGQPCDWHLLRDVADKHGLVLIDDAAHALPSALHGRRIGSWADLTAFSFYATKTLTTGEGGMLVTNTLEWAERAAAMALHGISKDAWKRYTAEGSWYYEVVAPGFKYNMTDIAAALGLGQLQRLEQMHQRRSVIAARYTDAFADLPEVQPPCTRMDRTTAWQLYILRLHLDRLRCDRADFIHQLTAANIGASVHFIPLQLHPYYRDSFGYAPNAFPVAYTEYQRAVSLPIYSRMSDRDVEDVVAAIHQIVAANRR
jgi:dTDP-4-amino-4,6-dideoxygalactose transaminase